MRPTDQLKEEHKAITVMLDVLGKMCEKLGAGEQVSAEHLEQALDFFKGFADKCHHYKEESVLFPAMGTVGFAKEAGPIAVMLMEHNDGRNHVNQLGEGIARYKLGAHDAVSTIVDQARQFIEVLTAHIDKENNILFPMAEAHLPEEKQEQIAREFERVEIEIIGAGKHEEYHQLIKNLRTIYLG